MTNTPEAIVGRFFQRYGQRDTEGVLALMEPHTVWLGTYGGLDAQRVIRGSDAILEYMQEIEQPWERFEVEVERLIASGETVVAFLRETAQGRDAIDVQNQTAIVFKIRDARIVEGRGYLDRDTALEAAGLQP